MYESSLKKYRWKQLDEMDESIRVKLDEGFRIKLGGNV